MPNADYPEIRKAAESLLAVCDGAISEDGHGYNKPDGAFVRSVMSRTRWTPNMAVAMHKVLRKYRGQLAGFGIDYDALPVPKVDKVVEEQVNEEIKQERKVALADYIKSIQWSEERIVKDGEFAVQEALPDETFWSFYKTHKDELKNVHGISISKYTGEWKITKWTRRMPEAAPVPEIPFESIKLKCTEAELLPFQREHTRWLIRSMKLHNAALDASDTGVGKTFVALAVAKELGLKPIVMAPKATLPAWRKAAENHFKMPYYEVLNYEAYKFNKSKYFSRSGESGETLLWKVPADGILIFDEIHRCKDYKTINSKMLVQAKEQRIPIFCASATIADNPMQMYALGLTLELFKGRKGFWKWVREHGCSEGAWGGWEFNGSISALQHINQSIFPERGHRVAIKDLGDAFPENMIITDTYDMNENAKKIQAIYDEMNDQLKRIEEKEEGDSGHHLTILLRARQRIEILKVPTIVEMAQDLIEEGNSVAIFVNFDDTVLALAEKLETKCLIWGKNKTSVSGGDERELNRVAFQEGRERVVICNIRAGGVGISLHDEQGNFARVSLISPSWSAQDLKQALGRIHRAGGKSKSIQKLVFCAGTVEEDIANKVNRKIKQISTINDNELKGLF